MDWRHCLAALVCLQATLAVSFPARAAAPNIEGPSAVSVAPNTCFQTTVKAADPDGDATDLRVANVPSWAAYSSYRVGVTSYTFVYGCPTVSQVGAYDLAFAASDGNEEPAIKTVEIAVGVPRVDLLSEQLTGLPNWYLGLLAAVDITNGQIPQVLVQNAPSWAGVSSVQTADKYFVAIHGTPAVQDLGVYNTRLVVTVGGLTTVRAVQFVVAVDADSLSMISWLAPTENENGSPLRDLAGYRFYAWPTDSGLAIIQRLLTTNIPVRSLRPGLWKVAVSAVSASGVESKLSPLLPVIVRSPTP